MRELRLYRNIYCVNHSSLNLSGDTYTLISAEGISASTIYNGQTIESLTPVEESTGVYFVSLNPTFYSFDYIYSLQWLIKYTSSSPVKNITTKFRFQPINVSSNITLDIDTKNNIDIELIKTSSIGNIQIVPIYT